MKRDHYLGLEFENWSFSGAWGLVFGALGICSRPFDTRFHRDVALPLLYFCMLSQYSNTQADLKTTRQILVRFGHAPCVKLTLETRLPFPPPAPEGVRILRLHKPAAQLSR